MDLFIVEVLLATVVLRFIMIGALAYLLLPRGSACPHCGDPMAVVHHGWMALLLPRIERRFCVACGWSGVVRRVPVAEPAAMPPVAPD
jgi:hypothetical protein